MSTYGGEGRGEVTRKADPLHSPLTHCVILVTGKRETVEWKERDGRQVHGQIINNDTGSQNKITTDINCVPALALLLSSTSHSIPAAGAFVMRLQREKGRERERERGPLDRRDVLLGSWRGFEGCRPGWHMANGQVSLPPRVGLISAFSVAADDGYYKHVLVLPSYAVHLIFICTGRVFDYTLLAPQPIRIFLSPFWRHMHLQVDFHDKAALVGVEKMARVSI